MKFGLALKAMKEGKKVKLPSWSGYWYWKDDTIIMHCKDGQELDIRKTDRVEYTMSNIASEDWIIANEGNTPILGGVATFNFGEAIKYIKRGLKVARKGWNGKGIFVELQVPDENSKMSHPYAYIDTTGLLSNNSDATRNRVPWLPSQTDMLSEDWIFVE